MKRVYLSGAVSGTDDYIKRFINLEQLVRRNLSDVEVVNPVRILGQMPVSNYQQYIKLALQLLDTCDYILIMDNSEQSKGVWLEYSYATCMDKEVIYEDKLREWLKSQSSKE